MNTIGTTDSSDSSTATGTSGSEPTSAPVRIEAADILAAQRRLHGVVGETPCLAARSLGAEAGARVFLKREDLQPTGSFKERGAAHALARLTPAQRRRGVVAASAGNHALGLARHGPRLGVPVTLVMPERAARVKVERCRGLGATVVLVGDSFAEADVVARECADRGGACYVHPFDDPAVIAGQGTLGLEILRQVPQLDAILVPVGGGGLLAGVATAVKSVRPDVVVIAVEPAAAAKLSAARDCGRPTDIAVAPTFADGLAVSRIGRHTFASSQGRVDQVVVVSESEIAYAMLRLFDAERTAVEGAGAVTVAALLAGRIPGLAGKRVVALVGGANVDARTFARALELGFATTPFS